MLAQNLLARLPRQRLSSLTLNHLSVVGVTAGSLAIAYVGEDAYEVLETAYEVGLVALVVPLTLGLYRRGGSERAAVASMIAGTLVWLVHLALGLGELSATDDGVVERSAADRAELRRGGAGGLCRRRPSTVYRRLLKDDRHG